jgi:hypothetical protein
VRDSISLISAGRVSAPLNTGIITLISRGDIGVLDPGVIERLCADTMSS